ncbi:DNA-binding protein [Candidatus Termititenax persephonae]|uniref:DNA-binding protein n=1 Tax=Candidatus Termititenax persephonae TaxID=2218525 RepID=A0A388THW2_9BACT|nr:DNA-binding protein [Candidatus Termititenax persephonae]
MRKPKILVPTEVIENKILLIRGKKVILDKDLANLYEVLNKNLNKAVKRNRKRFPPDFMFQLSKSEFANLKFQNGTSSWGGVRKLPYVFTEHGILMLSSVLNSERAVNVNIQIMRTFVKLREAISTNQDLQRRIAKIIKHQQTQDQKISAVVEVINKFFTAEKERPQKQWGFLPPPKSA